MDNLAHTLAGAVLSEAGLNRKTRLALPTLMIAANLPDVDVIGLLFGENLAFRRGITHGPLGLLILPLLLVGAMWLWDRRQVRRGKRGEDAPPLHLGWLTALAYIGAISHPMLDWLNTYGVRCLSRFSERWFYGDTLFIIDVWMWTILTVGVVWSQMRRRRARSSLRPAQVALATFLIYVAGMWGLSQYAEGETARQVADAGERPELVVASPPPFDPFAREMIWRTERQDIGARWWRLGDGFEEPVPGFATNMDDPRVAAAAERSEALRDFLFWARMPFARFEGDRVIVSDARYASANRISNNTFTVEVDLSLPPTE